MDASDHSGGDSDADALPHAHPTADQRHGVSCAFARGRCGHEELFHPHYTRTNLRKGDKILRCFPHCCPDHVTRSFCGASLPLDVRWASASSPSSSSSGAVPDVQVFARFRVQDERGRVPGDHVTLAEIAQSQQSESNPHGEWIAATCVSAVGDSALARTWVFELNHEARWYYHWESGVAKRHRLKHHVLEVYVLSPTFSTLSAAHVRAGDRRPLEVVAVARSPPFRLISFRRATPKAVQALSVPRVPRAPAEDDARDDDNDDDDDAAEADDNRKPVQRTTSPRRNVRQRTDAPPPPAPPQPNETSQPATPVASSRLLLREAQTCPLVRSFVPSPAPLPPSRAVAPLRQYEQHPANKNAPLSRPPPVYAQPPHAPHYDRRDHGNAEASWLAQATFPPAVDAGRPSFADLTAFMDRRARPPQRLPPPPPPSLQPSATALASRRLLRLLRCLDRVAVAETVQYMDTFQRVYADALARASGVDIESSLPVNPIECVHRVLADARVLHGRYSYQRGSAPPPLPAEVTAIVSELLLWLSFDVELHRAVHATVAQDASAVLSQPRLQTAFAGLVAWLECHVDAFLRDRGWRLEDVVRAVDGPSPGRRGDDDHKDDDPQDAFARGLRVCVGQFSEDLASQAKAAAQNYRQQQAKRRPTAMAHREHPTLALPPPPRGCRAPSLWSINGRWKCDMLRGGLTVRASSTPLVSSDADFSLLSLFTLLRELGAVSIRLGDSNDHASGDAPSGTTTPATMVVTSLLNARGESDDSAATRLTLDQTSQWFGRFPSGLSTSALRIGGCQWGDHAGELSRTNEVVHCNVYAWTRSPPSLDAAAGTTSSLGRCVQLQLWTPTLDTLIVRVAVSRAVLDPMAAARVLGLDSVDAVVQQLPFCSLQQKLRLVRAWEPTREAELQYSRVRS